ncbi:MAG: oxidoreductase molybdopterin binding protein [Pseudonocardiales bacterium]|nr:oxidoreductase molybdopterin binding protein [Pseudonocardiales bacterium]
MDDTWTVKWSAATGAACGLIAAGAGLGIGEVVAAFVRPEASPIVVVANRFILATPEWLKQAAIRNFGTDDKLALKVGIYVVIAVLAALVGWRAMHRLAEGLVGLALFGAIGIFCALTTHAHRASDVVPVIIAALAAGLILTVLIDSASGTNHLRPRGMGGGRVINRRGIDRRRLLVGGAAGVGLAAVAGFGGRKIQHQRFDASRSRAAITLPEPTSPAAPLPAAADLGRSPLPFRTPNGDFYRIDTAFVLPQLTADDWKLSIHGLVDHPFEITYAELLAEPLVERWITLACVSQEVGGDLIGNALWRGALLAPLLKRAGVRAGADQLVSRSKDGMTIGTPVAAVMDGRDAMLAVGMNGVPLPVAHGFPVRMVVPGLYGYVSACKWITDIEVTTFGNYDAYWVQRGWVQQLPIELSSRIDTPAMGKKVKAGDSLVVAGVAWHQHVGVGKVEVQIDGGAWTEARLGDTPTTDTWRQWILPWTVSGTGEHRITVRAVDPNGKVQSPDDYEPLPGASSGLHHVTVYAS